ncbi:furin-like protease 1 isoform X2 [Lucilia sericata]|uniref:furin-like protease 1 isoform X2 n=1 Tax=Lucilia sericata TaxID=13632 RepID=UPI0018A827CE|nr:furin-like protease 1 isoform X2 [Lucilia sericata]
MQNDVVRWSSTICNLYSCNNKHIYANNNKLYKRTVHKLCSCKEEKDKNVDKTTSHELLSTIAFNESKNLSVKCDTNVYDLYLVQDIVNSSRFLKKDKSQKYFYQQLNGGKGRRRSNNNIYNSYGTRLLFLLQLSVLVILCSLNIGFVTSANLEEKVLPSSDTHKFIHGLHEEESLNNIGGHYTHTWAVHIPDGDKDGKAEKVANDHGFINLGRIFDDHYHFAHRKVSKRSLTAALSHQIRLDEDDRVSWAQQQIAKSRRKRDFIHMRPSRTSSISAYSMVDAVPFNDPKWPQMWYLNRGGDLDMNVIPAWKEGITGKGIVVTILDDGLESDHPDIISNYDPKASYDVNSHDPDPMPHYDLTDSNRHGTRCAGEVAATANNTICAVGIAFGASVGGVRMLDGDVTDAVEARSLSLNPQHIDIYSASWGPDDDGKTVDGPGELASRAFIEGVTKGRNGKGSIFIWASGNGGRELDNCNCDGYTNSIWTLSISSATEEGHVPWYSEKCSSTLATTYSSGSQTEKQVVTTDLHHSCTVSHTGTSASAPLAAGIAALVLESNTNLTWRDLQHIVVRTAKPANLIDPNWSKNGVGRRVSHSFGYGLMDASAMVRLARNWKTVPEQQRCEINAPHVDKVIPPKGHITLQLSVKNCLNINFLEHVQAKITLTSQRRGDIQLNLISPAGTKVTLLTPRVHDTSHSGFNQWPFMSVHTWGESPHGNWQLEIHNEGRYMGHALLREWSLIFYGTTQPIYPNDPVSTARTALVDITTPNSSSASTNLHQIYSAQYPRMSNNNNLNFSKFGLAGKLSSSKLPLNKSVYVAANSDIRNDPLFKAINQGPVSKKQQQSSKNTKVNKNGKGKSLENNKSNKNSNNGGRPLKQKESSTQVTPGSHKNKFYRISQQSKAISSKSQNPLDANIKQKINKLQQSSERFQSPDEKAGRKVIGDLQSTSSTNINNGKFNSKSAAKATKHVKESSSTKQPLLTTDIIIPIREGSISMQSNQRITKLFERYEKIQSIFPEFQPYQPILKDKNDNVVVLKSTPKQGPLEVASNIGADSTTITKPLRENSKKSSPSFVPDKQILKKQQLLLAAAGVDATQVPSMAIATSNKKHSNAQITQWDLIFYGTEIPAQPDDPTPSNSKQFSPFRNDMVHNDIDYEPNDQWNNMQQMGKPSMMTHDRTNTSCVKTTINQQCLACAPPNLFYRGRCYDICPIRTYALSHINRESDTLENNEEINRPKNLQDEEELQSIDRKKRSMYLYGNTSKTGAYNRKRADSTVNNIVTLSCEPCDKSCLQCYGPLSSQCSSCSFGRQLKRMKHTNETYCINFSERSSGNAFTNSSTREFNIKSIMLILVPSIIIVLLGISFATYRKGKCLLICRRELNDNEDIPTYTYDRVALFADEDNQEDDDDLKSHTCVIKMYTDDNENDNLINN